PPTENHTLSLHDALPICELSDQTIWDTTPALPTRYQDDPSMAPGQLKQVDWSAPGAKTSFRYRVVRNGEVLQHEVFKTVYQPWRSEEHTSELQSRSDLVC